MIDPSLVRDLAAIARIELTPGEDEALAAELARTVEHLAALRDLPADSAPALPYDPPNGAGLELRPDLPGADPLLLPLSRIAPRWTRGMFIVPSPPGLDVGE